MAIGDDLDEENVAEALIARQQIPMPDIRLHQRILVAKCQAGNRHTIISLSIRLFAIMQMIIVVIFLKTIFKEVWDRCKAY